MKEHSHKIPLCVNFVSMEQSWTTFFPHTIMIGPRTSSLLGKHSSAELDPQAFLLFQILFWDRDSQIFYRLALNSWCSPGIPNLLSFCITCPNIRDHRCVLPSLDAFMFLWVISTSHHPSGKWSSISPQTALSTENTSNPDRSSYVLSRIFWPGKTEKSISFSFYYR